MNGFSSSFYYYILLYLSIPMGICKDILVFVFKGAGSNLYFSCCLSNLHILFY